MAVDTPLNINLMNLCLEILDNEHDLDRANGETNPLYIYCSKHITDVTLQEIFTSKTYLHDHRFKSINPKQILIKMKDIVRGRNDSRLTFIPGGASSSITYNYQESIISHGKTFDNLRTLIIDRDKRIGQCIAETYRGVESEPKNQRDKMVDVYRSELTTQFDNSCRWNNVILQNARIIGEIGKLGNPNRIYDNYFPKAASVFVYGSEVKGGDAIIDLILVNIATSTSVVPFVEDERDQMIIDLNTFITSINDKIETGKLYLLHIFKNFTQQTASGKAGGGIPQYSFSLQMGQVELNEVSMELYGYNKRGSNILCKTSTKISDDKMIFSNMSDNMRQCHISYGKLCGDGVTIFATKKAQFIDKPLMYNAVISIDEFCCLRAVYAGIIVAYQQKPSAMAGTGLGRLSTTRNHGIYKVGNLDLSPDELVAKEKADATKAEDAAVTLAATDLIKIIFNIFNSENTNGLIKEFLLVVGDYNRIITTIYDNLTNSTQINITEEGTLTGLAVSDTISQIKAAFSNSSLNINNMVDFCVKYNNILANIGNITTIGRSSRRSATTQTQSNMADLFGGLGTLETLIQTYLKEDKYYKISRRHIVYIMITRLLTKSSFMDNIADFINSLFDIQPLPAKTENIDAIRQNEEFNNTLSSEDTGLLNPANYKTIYGTLIVVYNVFNQYNCDDDLANGNITEAQCKYKHMLRQRLVIFKYIYRAYITCCWVKKVVITPATQGSPVRSKISSEPSNKIVFKSWHDISVNINNGKLNWNVFDAAYNKMIQDDDNTITSPNKSPPNAVARASTEGEYEDQLGEVAIDDTFTYNSAEANTSCESKIGGGVCGVVGTIKPGKSPRETKPRGLDFEPYKGGGIPTRKRKSSKIPRRTIRRRAPRRTQKRTIRRQRRNKKGTQKRRK